MTLTFFEASKLPVGTRLRLTTDHGNYPNKSVPAGETGTIFEQGLNEMEPYLAILLDNLELREHYAEWGGCLHVYGPVFYPEITWEDTCGLEVIAP
jgi:hypothetical protein